MQEMQKGQNPMKYQSAGKQKQKKKKRKMKKRNFAGLRIFLRILMNGSEF